jgi:CxxC-x17-CxxC domain-containing protein
MAEESGQFKRPMFDVTDMDIKCADCGKPITELPFKPDPSPDRKVFCRDCYRKNRP